MKKTIFIRTIPALSMIEILVGLVVVTIITTAAPRPTDYKSVVDVVFSVKLTTIPAILKPNLPCKVGVR